MLLFALMNLAVGYTAFLLAYRIFRFGLLVDSLQAWFIFFLSQIILSQTILGAAGKLWLPNLLILNAAILLLVWRFSRNQPQVKLLPLDPALAEILNNPACRMGLSVVAGFGLVKIIVNLLNPPFGWDDLNYHFTFPVEWLKNGNLVNPATVFDDPSPTYYPLNGSLFFLWLIFPFKSVFLADLGQLPFYALGFLSVYSLGKKMRLLRWQAFSAAVLFSLIPNYFKQLEIAYVDVMVAGLFLTALNSLFIFREEFSLRSALVFGLSLGLLVGTKTLGLPYALLLLIPFLYFCSRDLKNRWGAILVSLACLAATGGFSYLRNFLSTGNPLYPFDLAVFGHRIFAGVMDKATYASHFTAADYSWAKYLFHEGLGPQTLLFVFPFIVLAFPLGLLKKRREIDFLTGYFLLLSLLIYIVFRFVVPLGNVRYLYNLLAVGMVSGFWCLAALKVPPTALRVAIILCAAGSIAELAKKQELAAAVIIGLAIFLFIPVLVKRPVIFPVLCAAFFFSLPFLEQYYLRNEYSGYLNMARYSGFWPEAAKAWIWLNGRTSGDNIAYAGRPVPFPLYGSRFKNNVRYVSVNATDPARMEYFKGGRYNWGSDYSELHASLLKEGNYREHPDYRTWLKNLEKNRIGWLFIYSLHHIKDVAFPIEDEWARDNPKLFFPAFSNTTIHIYEVRQ